MQRGGFWEGVLVDGVEEMFCERAHSERREATDGEKRPREANSNDTPERRQRVKLCVH